VHIQQKFLTGMAARSPAKSTCRNVCVKTGRDYDPLDYYRHLVGKFDVTGLAYRQIDWPRQTAPGRCKDRFYRFRWRRHSSNARNAIDFWRTTGKGPRLARSKPVV